MSERKISVFFYGSYINLRVLEEVQLRPDRVEVACLHGYDISIAPLANVFPSDQHSVYGIVADATHAELDRLYTHAREVLGGAFLPEAVVVQTRDGSWRPALCYVAANPTSGQPNNDYIDRILQPGRELQFPDWYLARLESFRS